MAMAAKEGEIGAWRCVGWSARDIAVRYGHMRIVSAIDEMNGDRSAAEAPEEAGEGEETEETSKPAKSKRSAEEDADATAFDAAEMSSGSKKTQDPIVKTAFDNERVTHKAKAFTVHRAVRKLNLGGFQDSHGEELLFAGLAAGGPDSPLRM
eukprot:s3896_g3.t1